jgi:hypothetical protein
VPSARGSARRLDEVVSERDGEGVRSHRREPLVGVKAGRSLARVSPCIPPSGRVTVERLPWRSCLLAAFLFRSEDPLIVSFNDGEQISSNFDVLRIGGVHVD